MKRPPPNKEKPSDVRQHIRRPDNDRSSPSPAKDLVSLSPFFRLTDHAQSNNNLQVAGDFVSRGDPSSFLQHTTTDSPCQKDVTTLASLDAAIERERELMQAADDQGDDLEFVDCYTRLLTLYEAYFNTRRMVENDP